MTSIPNALHQFNSIDIASHRVQFNPEAWRTTFVDHEEALTLLAHHAHTEGGITRAYIHKRAATDPLELFLISMVWGYGKIGYGPRRINDILNQVGAAEKIHAVVEATRNDGPAAGWNALLNTHRIGGLDMSFGTKLLYFARLHNRPPTATLDPRQRRANGATKRRTRHCSRHRPSPPRRLPPLPAVGRRMGGRPPMEHRTRRHRVRPLQPTLSKAMNTDVASAHMALSRRITVQLDCTDDEYNAIANMIWHTVQYKGVAFRIDYDTAASASELEKHWDSLGRTHWK